MKRLSILALYSMVATPAIADIASKSYVDSIIDSLATVATSGSYNDLSNKPTIPAITDTYDTTSMNGMSGKAVASAISAHNSSSAAHSDIRNALNAKANDANVLHKSGGELDRNASLKFNRYGNRFLTIDGNDLLFDLSSAVGGWAGSMATLKDSVGIDYTMLGYYGYENGLIHLYMGGAHNDPYFKMLPNGDSTFKNVLTVGTPTEDTTTSKQADTVGARNSKINSHDSSSSAHTDIRNALNTKVTIPSGGSAGQVLKKQSDGSIGWANDIDTDTNTTYNVMGAASSDKDGTSGLVPAPSKGDQGRFLKGDATWTSLADVATSGSYNDLSNKPTIPTVPTNISSFNNDSGYITNSYHDSTKQDRLPQWPGGAGKYRLVVNTYTGQLGWELEQFSLTCPTGTYDIGFEQCVNPATNGEDYGYINDSRGAMGSGSYNSDIYGLTADQTWAAEFSYGIIKGIASCNSTSGDNAYETWSNDSSNWLRPGNTFTQDSEGQYCWCKMTSPSASGWVFRDDVGSADNCADYCADYCAKRVQRKSNFRSAVVSAVGQ